MIDDQQDFSGIYSEYYPKIVGYVRRFVADEDAEDVAQETMVKANRSMDSFRGESKLSTWLYRIATNTAMDHLRRSSVRHSSREGDGAADREESDDDLIVDVAPLHDTLLIRKDMNECIRGLVNELPEKYRSVLVLTDLEGFTNDETGDVLGLSLHTVKIRLHRARYRLKQSMDQACHLYRDGRNELSCDRKTSTLQFSKE